MRLVSCARCHTQFDLSRFHGAGFDCYCGARVSSQVPQYQEVPVERCSSCGASIAADAAECHFCRSAVVTDERRRSLICPDCCARNIDGARFCNHCGVPFRPQPIWDDGDRVPCPGCSGKTRPRSISEILVHECGQCEGLWVPLGSLEKLIRKACHALSSQDEAPDCSFRTPFPRKVIYRKCPVCRKQMERTNYDHRSGVIVDRCHADGTYLDVDELQAIVAYAYTRDPEQGDPYEDMLGRERMREAARSATHLQKMKKESAEPRTLTGQATSFDFSSIGNLLDHLIDHFR